MPIMYSVVVPAYNESENIERAIRETVEVFTSLVKPYEIIVVDDGSADKTADIVRQLCQEFPRVNLVVHESNRGKGEAVRTGVAEAEGEYVLFVDADLATHPREVLNFLPHCESKRLIIGTRTDQGAGARKGQPFYRVWLGKFFNFFVRKTMALPYRDTQCGFKMFDRETGKRLFAETPSSRWLFDVDLIVRAKANGCQVVELPVAWEHRAASRMRFAEVAKELPRMWRLRRLAHRLRRDDRV